MVKSHGSRQKTPKKRLYKVKEKIVEENGMILIQTNQPKSKKFYKTLDTITVISPEEDCLIDVETLVKDDDLEQECKTDGKRNSLNNVLPSISYTKCDTCTCELENSSCAGCVGGTSVLLRMKKDGPVSDLSIINENASQQTTGNESINIDKELRYIKKVYDLEKNDNTNVDNIQGLLKDTIKLEPVDFDDHECDSVRILYQDSHELRYVEQRIKLEPKPETGHDVQGVDEEIEVHPEPSLNDSWINNSPGFGAVNSHQTVGSNCIQATTSRYRETPKTYNNDKQEHLVVQSDSVIKTSVAKVGSDEIEYTYFHESGFVVFHKRFGTRFVNVFSCVACHRVHIFISEVHFNHDRNYCISNCRFILKSHAIHTLTDFQQCQTCSFALKYVAQCLLQRETSDDHNSSVQQKITENRYPPSAEIDKWKCSVPVISKTPEKKSPHISSKTPPKLRINSYSMKKKSHVHVSLKTFKNISPQKVKKNSYSMIKKSHVSPKTSENVTLNELSSENICPSSLRKTNSEIENWMCDVPVISKAHEKSSSIKVNHSYSMIKIPFVSSKTFESVGEKVVKNVSYFRKERSTRKKCFSMKQYESLDVQCSLQVSNCSIVIPKVDHCLTERRSCDMCNKQYIQTKNLCSAL